MALSTNPTKTRHIENAYRKEVNKRYKIYERFVVKTLRASQQIQNALITNATFSLTPEQIDRMMNLMRQGAYKDIIGVTDPRNANSSVEPYQTTEWQKKYISSAYVRGIQTGQAQLKALGLGTSLTIEQLRDMLLIGTDEELARLLASVAPVHGETVEALMQNSLAAFVQNTQTMLFQMREKIETGNNVSSTSRMIAEVKKSMRPVNGRLQTVASTDTIQAAQRGQINNAAVTEAETGQVIKLRWLTRKDDRVRHLHANWHGVVMTKAAASENINESKWNCRCGFAQEPPAAYNDPKRNAMFAKEREQLLAMQGGKGKGSPPPSSTPAPAPKPKPAPAKPKPKTKGVRPKGYAMAGSTEQTWVDNSLINNGYNKILPKVSVPRDIGDTKRGAYYQNGKINMAKYDPTTPNGQAVYRHEYGHAVDHELGLFSGKRAYDLARHNDAIAIDTITKPLGKNYRDAGVGNTRKRGANYIKDAFNANTVKNYHAMDAKNIADVKAWGAANLPKGTDARALYDLIDFDAQVGTLGLSRSSQFIAALKEAADMGDNPVLIAQSLWRYGGSSVLHKTHNEAGQIADLLESINIQYGGGHGSAYYKKRYQAQHREAFAQLFSIHGTNVNNIFKKLADALASNQNKLVKDLLNG